VEEMTVPLAHHACESQCRSVPDSGQTGTKRPSVFLDLTIPCRRFWKKIVIRLVDLLVSATQEGKKKDSHSHPDGYTFSLFWTWYASKDP